MGSAVASKGMLPEVDGPTPSTSHTHEMGMPKRHPLFGRVSNNPKREGTKTPYKPWGNSIGSARTSKRVFPDAIQNQHVRHVRYHTLGDRNHPEPLERVNKCV